MHAACTLIVMRRKQKHDARAEHKNFTIIKILKKPQMWYRTDGGPVKCDFSRLTELPGLLTLRILEGITHVKHALSLRSERVVIGHEQKTPIW